MSAERDAWRRWDTIELIRNAQARLPLLVDQAKRMNFQMPSFDHSC